VNLLDVIILLLVLAVAIRGVASGFLRQVGSLGGFLLGLLLGATIAPLVGGIFSGSDWHWLIVLVVFFGVAFTVAGLGETLGYTLSGLAERYRLRPLDATLGAALGVVIALTTVWLLASTFARTAGPFLIYEFQTSRILQGLDRSLPPAPDVMAKLDRAFGAGGFPRVFTGLEPSPAPPVTGPNAAAVNAAAAAGRAATVRIEGLGCGGLLEGSGFVAAPGLVATNAHVISASPLRVASTNQARGTVGAVLGYPGGGAFTVSPAAVLDRRIAIGRNIYDSGLIHRDIYVLQSVVRPGNSGGPVVTPDGTVIGVVFATSTVNGNIGYALTSAEVQHDLSLAATAGAVPTGACVSE
jgi:uncharacterized membrane protein required for colicin V production